MSVTYVVKSRVTLTSVQRRVTPFEAVETADLTTLPMVNVVATLRLTHIVVPSMLQAKRGLVLNIGSLSAHVPPALLATCVAYPSF